MTEAEILLPVEERIRRQDCAQEPIHIPGAIQPHGALVALDPVTLEILQASDNTGPTFGIAAPDLLGTSLGDLIAEPAEAQLRALLATGGGRGTNPVSVEVGGRPFDAIAHLVNDTGTGIGIGIVEFEPAASDSATADYLADLHTAIRRLLPAADETQLRTLAAREMRRLSGFDQVMVYSFHPDGHGEVVADDHRLGMTTHLGLHFPSSDIPAQARRLYLQKSSGLTASSNYQPAQLLPLENPRTGAPLDLSRAELRSVSPFHRQFMRNMGQGSSLTLPMAMDGQLQGMITCANRRPRRVPFLLRRACEILAQQVTLQLDAMARTGRLTRQIEAQDVRNLLVDQMELQASGATGLIGPDASLLDLVGADGATVRLSDTLISVGSTPTEAQTTALLRAQTRADGSIRPLVSDALTEDRADLAELVPAFAGLFILPFGGTGDCLVWFRRQVAQTVDWLGEQTAANREAILAPRISFSKWRQAVTDRSIAWDEVEISEAAELARDIDQVLLHRAEAQLAYLGRHDSLTGLPNRNLLIEQISSAISRADHGGNQVAVLFCDLDDFKQVNDTAGHAAGDAVLVEAAARLKAVVRPTDSIARVGGDEFVVVLEPAWPRDPNQPRGDADGPDRPPAPLDGPDMHAVAAIIAARITTELSRPIRYLGTDHVISVSVGVSLAGPGSRAEDVLGDADAAMYRAKNSGKNRVEVFGDSARAGRAERARAEAALKSALGGAAGGARLGVEFQPVIEVSSGRLVSFAAKTKLTDSTGRSFERALVGAVAAQVGLSAELGARVLDAALAGLLRWRAEHRGDPPVRVALDATRLSGRPGFSTTVRAALDRRGAVPSDLTLELTEAVLMHATAEDRQQLAELRAAGITIAVGDFGNGSLSLRRLSILPLDVIQIAGPRAPETTADASSADAASADTANDDAATAGDAGFIRAVAGLAGQLGLSCIVGGIDTRAQLDSLPLGVWAQGLLLGPPSIDPSCDWRLRER